MDYKKFLYRQKQRFKYHTTSDITRKRIAEINRSEEKIVLKKESIYVKELDFTFPISGFEFVFGLDSFELLIGNAKSLHGQYTIHNQSLCFSFDYLTIEITGGSDLFIINEIFIKKCYNFKIPGNEKIIVIDVGMNVGLAALFFAQITQVEKVYAFEPFSSTFKKAQANFLLNPALAHKIGMHNFGWGAKDENITVSYDALNSVVNSTVTESPKVKATSKEMITMKQAKSVVSEIARAHERKRILIKIDTEGAEYDILANLFSERLPETIIGFMIEWHFQGPEVLERHLLTEGFKIHSISINNESGLIYAYR